MSFGKYIDRFPIDLRKNKEWQEFAEFLDNFDNDAIGAVTEMKNFWDIEKAPEYLLNFIGYSLGAQIGRGDSDRLKRQKIRDAVKENQRKGTEESAKYWIEQITGIEPSFRTEEGHSKFMVWESQKNLLPFPNHFFKWASEKNKTSNGMGWGVRAVNTSQERYIVFVDLKIDKLSTISLDRLEKVVEYFGAAYIRYHLGYQDKGWYQYRTVN